MPRLHISNFSCIRDAELELKPITVLIGPQASGKSVISKLFYFFAGLETQTIYEQAEEGNTLRLFHKALAKKFSELFPPAAWGPAAFRIHYEAGPWAVTISRKKTQRGDLDEAAVSTSEYLTKHYEELLTGFRKISRRGQDDDDFGTHLQRSWPVRRESMKKLRQDLGEEYVNFQFFIPAGRSFFTNLGKAVAILEHGSQLDEITKTFGRLFTGLLDRRYRAYIGDKPPARVKEFLQHQKRATSRLFGGEIKLSANDMHVSTPDGRRIQFSTLSSGQQELLPLILILQYYAGTIAEESTGGIDLLYIEEPEAHLFPASQGQLTEHLVEIATYSRGRARLLITTHSPYVLSKLNNMIKAFTVARDRKATEKVSELVPRSAWLDPAAINAYALEDKRLIRIRDDDGLIDASYLDRISSEISEVFMQLLEIEVGR